MPRNVHLVGSVPLASARDVFETVSAALGPRLKRIPDGETGERADWITWLEPVFANSPALEKSGELFRIHATATPRTRYRLKGGKTAADVTFGNLFYADIAARSYREFTDLKRQGKILTALPLPGRSGARPFRAVALSAGRPARAARPGLQRGGEAGDRQDRGGDPARSAGDPVRRRICGVRAAGAQRREQLRALQGGDAGEVQRHHRRSRQSCAARHRTAVPFLLRRQQPSPRRRADRHVRHGGDGEPADARRSRARST